MNEFKADNPFLHLRLTFPALCNLNSLKGSEEIKPGQEPLLIGIEAVRDRTAPANSQQTASRYNLVLPASSFLRISIKVDEPAPSITPEMLEKCGGAIRVSVEGFSSGAFEVDGGGARPYFKATKITPMVSK